MSSKTLRNRYGRATGPQCSKCLKRFRDNGRLRDHKDRVHNENRVDRFECDTCHCRFGYKSDMKRHVRTVHLKERRFFCGDCGQAFFQSSHRNAHVRMMHDNIRSAACFHCGKTFASDGHLMRHTRRVHYKEKYAHPRPCSECAFVAENLSKLRTHFRVSFCAIACNNKAKGWHRATRQVQAAGQLQRGQRLDAVCVPLPWRLLARALMCAASTRPRTCHVAAGAKRAASLLLVDEAEERKHVSCKFM